MVEVQGSAAQCRMYAYISLASTALVSWSHELHAALGSQLHACIPYVRVHDVCLVSCANVRA